MAREKLTDKLCAHPKNFFDKRNSGENGGGAEWYLHLIVFPSLLDIAERIDAIAERIDAIEEQMAKREKKRGTAKPSDTFDQRAPQETPS